MFRRDHYFDWAATSLPDEEILQKALKVSLENTGNPSSLHTAGSEAKKALENARNRCAKFLNVNPEHIYFTSGGTESNHLALLSVLTKPVKGSIVVSGIEHPSIREMVKMLSNCGIKVITVNSNKEGIVTKDSILNAIESDTVLVSVMAVNNETGAIQPIYEIADALVEYSKNKRKPFFHIDCVQAAVKIPLELSHNGIDSASFSTHKFCGPRGCGLLYLSKNIVSFLRGGGQEKNIRSGTENLFGAEATALCLEKYFLYDSNSMMKERLIKQTELTQNFIHSLLTLPKTKIIPEARQNEENAKNYSPWVLQVSFEGIPGKVMQRALNEKEFYISTGSACSSGHQAHPVLDNLQLSAKDKEGTVRFSFGEETTEKAMNELFEAVKEIVMLFTH